MLEDYWAYAQAGSLEAYVMKDDWPVFGGEAPPSPRLSFTDSYERGPRTINCRLRRLETPEKTIEQAIRQVLANVGKNHEIAPEPEREPEPALAERRPELLLELGLAPPDRGNGFYFETAFRTCSNTHTAIISQAPMYATILVKDRVLRKLMRDLLEDFLRRQAEL